jgi:hypothetical protein
MVFEINKYNSQTTHDLVDQIFMYNGGFAMTPITVKHLTTDASMRFL